jgi:hypothetical protein
MNEKKSQFKMINTCEVRIHSKCLADTLNLINILYRSVNPLILPQEDDNIYHFPIPKENNAVYLFSHSFAFLSRRQISELSGSRDLSEVQIRKSKLSDCQPISTLNKYLLLAIRFEKAKAVVESVFEVLKFTDLLILR